MSQAIQILKDEGISVDTVLAYCENISQDVINPPNDYNNDRGDRHLTNSKLLTLLQQLGMELTTAKGGGYVLRFKDEYLAGIKQDLVLMCLEDVVEDWFGAGDKVHGMLTRITSLDIPVIPEARGDS